MSNRTVILFKISERLIKLVILGISKLALAHGSFCPKGEVVLRSRPVGGGGQAGLANNISLLPIPPLGKKGMVGKASPSSNTLIDINDVNVTRILKI